jgi:predicted anti-sigma-YlaC factor YlaD
VNPCHKPLDPLDIDALAAGAEPVLSDGAAAHAAGCPACRAAVAEAARLAEALSNVGPVAALPPDFADRVVRLRPFSRSERMRLALWGLPLGVGVAVFGAGILLLGAPLLTGSQQAGLATALLAPVPGILRAMARSAAETIRLAPVSLDALAATLRGDFAAGLGMLLLLVPASFGLRRAIARARSPR